MLEIHEDNIPLTKFAECIEYIKQECKRKFSCELCEYKDTFCGKIFDLNKNKISKWDTSFKKKKGEPLILKKGQKIYYFRAKYISTECLSTTPFCYNLIDVVFPASSKEEAFAFIFTVLRGCIYRDFYEHHFYGSFDTYEDYLFFRAKKGWDNFFAKLNRKDFGVPEGLPASYYLTEKQSYAYLRMFDYKYALSKDFSGLKMDMADIIDRQIKER